MASTDGAQTTRRFQLGRRSLIALLAGLVAAFGMLALPAAQTASAHHQDKGIDSDGDGQQNFDDTCPYDPDMSCAALADKDGDRYNANQDPCDTNPRNGECDADGDGEPNQYDPCPNVASGHMLGSDERLERQDRQCPQPAPGESTGQTPQPPGGTADPGGQPPPGTTPDPETGSPVVDAVPSSVPANAVSPEEFGVPFPLPDAQTLTADGPGALAAGGSNGSFLLLGSPKAAAVRVNIETRFRRTRRGTRVARLALQNVAGFTVEMRCRGRGCPFSRIVRLPDVATKYDASRRFRGATLRHGAELSVRVVRGELYGKWYRFRVGRLERVSGGRRAGRQTFRRQRLTTVAAGCLAPSSVRTVPCPQLAPGENAAPPRAAAATAGATTAIPQATAAGHTGAIVRIDSHWTGLRYDAYLTQASVRAVANRGTEGAYVACGFLAARAPYAGAACGASVFLWGPWLSSWLRHAATRGCLHLTYIPLSARAWRTPGFWIPPANPVGLAALRGWAKANIEVVPNAGPGGNCRAH